VVTRPWASHTCGLEVCHFIAVSRIARPGPRRVPARAQASNVAKRPRARALRRSLTRAGRPLNGNLGRNAVLSHHRRALSFISPPRSTPA